MDWVTSGEAPTADIEEGFILTIMATRADRDGCGVFLSRPKLAKACHVDVKTIDRRIEKLLERKLIGPGDPTSPGAQKHAKIRADNRPKLYDVLVPFDWYSEKQMADINEDRAAAGREPLTPENRPPIGPAPVKHRSDKGKKRPERSKKQPAAEAPSRPAETATGGLVVPPCEAAPEPVDNSERGDYKSPRGGTSSPVAGGLVVPQNCKKNLSEETVIGGASRRPPTPPAALTAGRVDQLVTLELELVSNQQTAGAKTCVAEFDSKTDDSLIPADDPLIPADPEAWPPTAATDRAVSAPSVAVDGRESHQGNSGPFERSGAAVIDSGAGSRVCDRPVARPPLRELVSRYWAEAEEQVRG
ncbi:hypothetical protein ACFROC_29160 [Nocardia tengchongensis]|uniref:hypothetical protein n=1 Tax=Nocardia tengchongensis TaxID=2055889 RepID=UPI0036996EE5